VGVQHYDYVVVGAGTAGCVRETGDGTAEDLAAHIVGACRGLEVRLDKFRPVGLQQLEQAAILDQCQLEDLAHAVAQVARGDGGPRIGPKYRANAP
jgi:hypothetical protein